MPLNETHFELEVNFLEYWEHRPDGRERHFAWVTGLPPIDDTKVMALMRAGRARWRIENETFNPLKNHGYNFEHNFGHGEKQLSTVFAYLMMPAFLIDQVQPRGCVLFAKARAKAERPRYFWEKLRGLFLSYEFADWAMLSTGPSPSGTGPSWWSMTRRNRWTVTGCATSIRAGSSGGGQGVERLRDDARVTPARRSRRLRPPWFLFPLQNDGSR